MWWSWFCLWNISLLLYRTIHWHFNVSCCCFKIQSFCVTHPSQNSLFFTGLSSVIKCSRLHVIALRQLGWCLSQLGIPNCSQPEQHWLAFQHTTSFLGLKSLSNAPTRVYSTAQAAQAYAECVTCAAWFMLAVVCTWSWIQMGCLCYCTGAVQQTHVSVW